MDVVVLVDHVPGEKINVDKQIFTSEEQRAAGGGGRRSTVRSIMQRFQDGLLDMSIKRNRIDWRGIYRPINVIVRTTNGSNYVGSSPGGGVKCAGSYTRSGHHIISTSN